MKRLSIVALLSATIYGLSFPSLSAGEEKRRPERCKQEIAELCPGILASSGKLFPCIKRRIGDFSQACRDIVLLPLPETCIEDGKSICPGLYGLGDGRFPNCMRTNINSFSQTCRDEMNGWYKVSESWRSKVRAACDSDKNICPATTDGHRNKWWICLNQNEDKLSASCKAFLRADRGSQ